MEERNEMMDNRQELIEQVSNPVQVVTKTNPKGYGIAGVIGLGVGFVVGMIFDKKLSERKMRRMAEFQGDEADEAVFDQM